MDSKYHSQWNCLKFQAHTILQQGHTWPLHSSHQALLFESDFKIRGRVLLIIGEVFGMLGSVFSVTAMIPNLMLHVHSATSFSTHPVTWSSQAPLGVSQYLFKSFLSHQPFIPYMPLRDPTLHHNNPTCEFSQTSNLLYFLISQEPGYLWNETYLHLIGQFYRHEFLIGWWNLSKC